MRQRVNKTNLPISGQQDSKLENTIVKFIEGNKSKAIAQLAAQENSLEAIQYLAKLSIENKNWRGKPKPNVRSGLFLCTMALMLGSKESWIQKFLDTYAEDPNYHYHKYHDLARHYKHTLDEYIDKIKKKKKLSEMKLLNPLSAILEYANDIDGEIKEKLSSAAAGGNAVLYARAEYKAYVEVHGFNLSDVTKGAKKALNVDNDYLKNESNKRTMYATELPQRDETWPESINIKEILASDSKSENVESSAAIVSTDELNIEEQPTPPGGLLFAVPDSTPFSYAVITNQLGNAVAQTSTLKTENTDAKEQNQNDNLASNLHSLPPVPTRVPEQPIPSAPPVDDRARQVFVPAC